MLNRAYYLLKPYLPWGVRVGLRRGRAQMKRWAASDTWPIDPKSAVPPKGWPGWPNGARFAVVLTHDVESALGVERSEPLADLEAAMGFKSSFNFVPESYPLPKEIRERLAGRGFEIGIHGLKHDGKLYDSRETFCGRAVRINEYLKEWNAVGFRSPFMQHNLEWLQDLNVLYDSSTFDTDPFEPQPDGMGTIFPFWVGGAKDRGYLEMPYTLVQDFTLFTILQERTIDLWKRKVDWIAENGGMVLLNLHPDYIHFDSSAAGKREFPASLYRELLEYIQTRYAGQYWHGLPKELASYCAKFRPAKAIPSGRRIAAVAYTVYASDNRVLRYASALAERGDHVDVFALSVSPDRPRRELIDGVWLHRLQSRVHDEKGQWQYLLRLLKFLFRASWALGRQQLRGRYDAIHIHNVPDFLVFAAWLPRLCGCRIILDIHDIVPEFYASKFARASASGWVRLLKLAEWCSAHFAHHVIISNHLWYDKITGRSVSPARCSTYINYVDLAVFHPRARRRRDGAYRVIFPGGMQWHQGLDVGIRAFQKFLQHVPQAEFHIYGQGDQKPALEQLVENLGLQNQVRFFPPVPARQVADLLADSDLGVVPKRANSFGNEAYSTKIMEYMSQGVPVVASRTKIDCFYFREGLVHFFESENVDDLARAMIDVATDPALRRTLVENGLRFVEENCWERRKPDYFRLVDGLIDGKSDLAVTEGSSSATPTLTPTTNHCRS